MINAACSNRADEVYGVDLIGLCPKETYESPEGYAAELRAIGRIAAAMNGCHGIEVVEFSIESEDEFTLHDQRFYVEYNCEDLSLGENDGEPMLPGH